MRVWWPLVGSGGGFGESSPKPGKQRKIGALQAHGPGRPRKGRLVTIVSTMLSITHDEGELDITATLDERGVLRLACWGQSLNEYAIEVAVDRGPMLWVRINDFDTSECSWSMTASHDTGRGRVEWSRPRTGGFCATRLRGEEWHEIEVVATSVDDAERKVSTKLRLRLRLRRPKTRDGDFTRGYESGQKPAARLPDPVRGPAQPAVDDSPDFLGDSPPPPPTRTPATRPSPPQKPTPVVFDPSPARPEVEEVEDEAEAIESFGDTDEDDLALGDEEPVEEQPTPTLTTVQLGASAPAKVRPGDEFTARFVAHGDEREREVRAALEQLSPRSSHRLGVAKTRWPVGVEVQVKLQGRGLEIDEPVRSFVWSGTWDIVDFDVYVPDDARARTTVLKFDASVAGLPTGRVRVDLEIVPAGTSVDPASRVEGKAETFTSAFASYATEDRLRVLDQVAAMQRLTGIDVFLDCVSLRAGDNFERRIFEEVRKRELYLLFWSRAASKSLWVDREWRLAWDSKEPEAFMVQPLEPHDQAPPPEELRHLNFNDPLLMIRTASELMLRERR